MKQENEAYLLKMQQFQSELDLLSKEYAILQQQVSHDLVKQKAASLYEKLAKAKEKKAEFELAIQKSELESGPQERNRLLEQVKNDNLETSAMERKIADYEVKIAQLTKDTSLDTESDPAQVEKQAKFDELVQREKEMQEFMDSFPLTKNEISEQILSTETEITDLLTKIQNLSLRNSSAMPSKESFKDVSNTLSLKNTDLRNSENTVDALAQGTKLINNRKTSTSSRLGKSRAAGKKTRK